MDRIDTLQILSVRIVSVRFDKFKYHLKGCKTARYNTSKATASVMPNVGKGQKWIHFLLLKTSKDMRGPLVLMFFPVFGAHQAVAEKQHYTRKNTYWIQKTASRIQFPAFSPEILNVSNLCYNAIDGASQRYRRSDTSLGAERCNARRGGIVSLGLSHSCVSRGGMCRGGPGIDCVDPIPLAAGALATRDDY